MPTPVPVAPTYHGMLEEDVAEAEEYFYSMWRFYHIVFTGEQHWICLRILAEDKDGVTDASLLKTYLQNLLSCGLRENLFKRAGLGHSLIGYGAMEELGPFKVDSNGKPLFRNNYAWNKSEKIACKPIRVVCDSYA
ncbi:hypothetical protein GIB67_003075 [Kingdonia uniflora]|uniref:Uncharacterized protein n=1 Tax=Kingdonia uniflora TaxID=39325 RepID=A0A7J7N5N7_9MAGN|nr:hypothetical protein GIB67_003075 [Kingdonia uniflora]